MSINWIPNPQALADDRAELAGNLPETAHTMEAIRTMARAGDPEARELSTMLLGDIDLSEDNRAILEGTRD